MTNSDNSLPSGSPDFEHEDAMKDIGYVDRDPGVERAIRHILQTGQPLPLNWDNPDEPLYPTTDSVQKQAVAEMAKGSPAPRDEGGYFDTSKFEPGMWVDSVWGAILGESPSEVIDDPLPFERWKDMRPEIVPHQAAVHYARLRTEREKLQRALKTAQNLNDSTILELGDKLAEKRLEIAQHLSAASKKGWMKKTA